MFPNKRLSKTADGQLPTNCPGSSSSSRVTAELPDESEAAGSSPQFISQAGVEQNLGKSQN